MGVGAAIGAIGSAVGGFMEAGAASDAAGMAEAEIAEAKALRNKAVGTIEENQGNVDALQEFLTSMGDKGMEFAQGLLDDWESSFGGIQDNLSDYYNNLDPDKFAIQNKVAFKANMDKQLKQYNETMASGGLQSAGMKAQTAKEMMFKTAETNAQIDINAPENVAQMKQGFLKFGDPQRAGAQNAVSTWTDRATQYGQAGHQAQTEQSEREADIYMKKADAHDKYAQGYGASAAGHAESSGNMFGSAMNLGLKAFGL